MQKQSRACWWLYVRRARKTANNSIEHIITSNFGISTCISWPDTRTSGLADPTNYSGLHTCSRHMNRKRLRDPHYRSRKWLPYLASINQSINQAKELRQNSSQGQCRNHISISQWTHHPNLSLSHDKRPRDLSILLFPPKKKRQFSSIRRQHLPCSVHFPRLPCPGTTHDRDCQNSIPCREISMRFALFALPLKSSILKVALFYHLFRVFVLFLVHLSESSPG